MISESGITDPRLGTRDSRTSIQLLDPNARPALPRASLVLIGLAWVVPFLQPYHRYPLTAFYSEWLALALGLGAALCLVSKDSWQQPTVPLIAFAPLALVILLALQVALGRVPYPRFIRSSCAVRSRSCVSWRAAIPIDSPLC